jgi:3-dehydroquinate synthase
VTARRRSGATRCVEVELGERSYPVHVGVDTLGDIGSAVKQRTDAKLAIVLTVPAIGRRYAGTVLRSLRDAGLRALRIDVPDGDRTKNLRQVGKLYEALLEKGADRSSVLVALGGGMVGDLTGFTAATFLRGIPFVQVPTSLLAMVDASVGGKTGVNLPQGKNLVGSFHQPRLVSIDATTLRSLPKRELSAGFAEIVKHAAIWDASMFEALEADAERLFALDLAALVPIIERNVEIKAEVVSRDEREHGVRMLLNFGHTLAHAVEALQRYRKMNHGEAVAIGMVYAARRSEALGRAPAGTADRLESLCRRFGLPTELPSYPRSAYLTALRVDKKKRDSHIHYVVLEGIGRARTVALTPAEVAAAVPRSAPRSSSRTGSRKGRRPANRPGGS